MRLPRSWLGSELASKYGGTLDEGCEDRRISQVVAPEDARGEDDLVLVVAPKRVAIAATAPGLLLVGSDIEGRVPAGRRWRHSHAMWVVAELLASAGPPEPADRVARSARVVSGAELHASVIVGEGAVILRGATIGEGTVVGENAVVFGGARIGARCIVGPLSVIGRQGFGFATGPGGVTVRVPQLGGVVIEDDVEIGALATVDAGTLRPTLIRRGAKLDAHVHVGHNVEIGARTFVAAQAGFAGSSRIGAGVLIGGQVGVKDHAEIGDRARVGGKSGVIGDVAPGDVVAGFPAVSKGRWLRAWAAILGEKRRLR